MLGHFLSETFSSPTRSLLSLPLYGEGGRQRTMKSTSGFLILFSASRFAVI
jgi:hypothetical protein